MTEVKPREYVVYDMGNNLKVARPRGLGWPSNWVHVIEKSYADALEAQNSELIKALEIIKSCNKYDSNPPADNKGPNSKAYWQWQEEQSREIAYQALAKVRGTNG